MKRHSVDSGILTLDGKRVTLPLPVGQVVDVGTALVVRLDVLTGTHLNRNVYLFDAAGRIVWQIEESPDGGVRDKPYMHVKFQDGVLIAENWIGVDYYVNLTSGKVKAFQLSK
jgi:hypothetical protein